MKKGEEVFFFLECLSSEREDRSKVTSYSKELEEYNMGGGKEYVF